ELDDTYRGLDKVAAALGPKGANENGALSRLIAATAASLDGNGALLNDTLREFAGALSTLASSSDDISGTVANLGVTTQTLAGKDATVRALVTNLARVGAHLNGQRGDLTIAVRQLKQALRLVAGFTRDTRSEFKSAVNGLTDVSDQLVNHLGDLEEMLDLGPVGLTSLVNIYEPRNWSFDKFFEVDPGAKTGALALRNGLLEDLDIALGYALSGFCAAMPAEQRVQLAAFCSTLESLGGNLGALIVQATHAGGHGVTDPVPGATTLGGLLTGGAR
ncbi:MAG TPA: hypothetical protein VLI04_21425, partial [Nocardioidaceae bacterium]|nr:hypothetical protein [Nocardioidaceae bacterium]